MPNSEILAELELTPADMVGKTFYRGRGCDEVQQHGLQGPRRACSN